jgi:penicillin-binding protein 2
MLPFNPLQRDDPALRVVSLWVVAGLATLLAGLWWVQVVHGGEYQSRFESQSYRTVRVAAPRGRILDRNGTELANNRPSYDVNLYLEEMRKPMDAEFDTRVKAAKAALKAQREAKEKALSRPLTKDEAKAFRLSAAQREEIARQSRLNIANQYAASLAQKLQIPLVLDEKKFTNHYVKSRSQPFPVVSDLRPEQVARFEEQFGGDPAVELEVRSVRQYPLGITSAHLLGYGSLKREGESVDGEQSFYNYREPDFQGLIGIEGGMDEPLRGQAGEKSLQVNYLGYRQTETILQPVVPGSNVVLTIDARLQKAALKALSHGPEGTATRGAIVVMDVHSGDVLALVSSPAYNPSYWVTGFPPGEFERLSDDKQKPEINRATYGNYFPGSIFKIVVGMAALEKGLNPEATFMVPPHPTLAGKGAYYIGRTAKKDQAAPGPYNFRRALAKSSNSYFVHAGREEGVLPLIIELGHRLHLGERAGIPTRQESPGIFPAPEQIRKGWSEGDTANLCIGQARVAATPLQVAVMISAIANGGTVYWPRLVQRLEPQDALPNHTALAYPAARARDQLGVSQRTMSVIHEAMLAETEDPEGTGHAVAGMPGFRVGGKTGTAQVADERNEMVDQFTWFASYGPWENPRYAVVVMVESGRSGGGTCAPLAREIYEAIQNLEKPQPIARNGVN